MSFMPMIAKRWVEKKITMIYFMVQSVGSLTVLAGGLTDNSLTSKWITTGLLLKASFAPFHFWGVSLIAVLRKINSFLFLTWQKIIPLTLLLIVTPKTSALLVVFLNIFVASYFSVSSKCLHILLFFSGLLHRGWILSTTFSLASKYFFFYCLISAPLFERAADPFLLFNLAGLPPMTGFFMKLSVLQTTGIRLSLILLLFSIALLFCYIRIFLTMKMKRIKVSTLAVCSAGLLV